MVLLVIHYLIDLIAIELMLVAVFGLFVDFTVDFLVFSDMLFVLRGSCKPGIVVAFHLN